MFKFSFLKQTKFNIGSESRFIFNSFSYKNFSSQKPTQKDYYKILEIKKNATEEEIKKAYRNLGLYSLNKM